MIRVALPAAKDVAKKNTKDLPSAKKVATNVH